MSDSGQPETMNRRAFVKRWAALAIALSGAAGVLEACQSAPAPVPSPVVVKETVTVPVEKTVVVEKEKTVVVEKVVTPTPVPKAKGEKTLVIGTSQEPESLFSVIGNLVVSTNVMSFMWRFPMEYGDGNRPRPVLAEELPSLKNGLWKIDEAKGTMEVTWRLKKGIKWSDGKEVTAKDVAFAFELSNDEQSGFGPSYMQPIERIEAKDPYTAVASYKALFPFPDLEYFRINVVPEHVYRPILEEYKKKGGEYYKAFAADQRVSVKPVVNGPYQVQEWVQGSHISLVRNPNYNLTPPPQIDKILIRIIPDLNTLSVNVATRQVHLTDGWLTLDQAKGLKVAPGVKVTTVPVSWLEQAVPQTMKPPLDDKRVRQALMFGMDRKGITDALFQGQQPPADTWLPPTNAGANPDVKKYPYDKEKARALLAEAGWQPGPDKILRNAKGEKLVLTIITIAGDRTREQVAAAIQSNWADLGAEVKIEPQTARLLFSETMPKGQIPAGGLAIWRLVVLPDVQMIDYWRPSKNSFILLYSDSPWGKNQRNVELLDQALKTFDPEKRYSLVKEQTAIWSDELPLLPLYWYTRVATVDDRLKGYSPFGDAQTGWNVEKWDLDM